MPNKLNYLLLACLILTQLSCKSNNTQETPIDSSKIEKTTIQSPKNQLSTLELLQGKWQSTEDKSNFLIFKNNQSAETYGVSEKPNFENFVLSNTCENELDKNNENPKEKDSYISMIDSDLCYCILEISKTNLSLSYVGRGNTLNYIKVSE